MHWFHISTGQFGYPQPEDNYLNKTYDSSQACPTCHIGIKQVNEFRFRSEPKALHSQFLGLNWVFDQIFARQPVREIFEKEGVTGISFSTPLIHKTGEPSSTIRQIHSNTLLKDALIGENLTSEICEYPKDKASRKFLTAIKSTLVKGPFCEKKKYNYPRGGESFKFKNGTFENMPDFVRLAEWFGSGASASQPIFVSEKVYDIIKSLKWRGAFLAPVEFS